MKKYLISTLTAAAAMAVPAFAGGTGTSDDPYTGTVSGLNPDNGGNTGGVVYIQNMTGGYWAQGSGSGTDYALTISSNLDISYDPKVEGSTNGITITDGYSDSVYTFTGTITGNGDWTHTTGTVAQKYIFTGSLAGYSGNITLTNTPTNDKTHYIHYGNGETAATNTNVSGTGSVTVNGEIVFNYSGSSTLTIGNTSIEGTSVEFTGSVNYTVSSDLVGHNSSSTLTISNTGTTTVSGSISGFSSVTVAEGSTLAISGAVSIGSAITNSGTVTLNSSVVFAIDGMTATSGSWTTTTGGDTVTVSYTLISGEGTITGIDSWDSLGMSNVSTSHSIDSVTFAYDSGTLTATITGLYDGVHGDGKSAAGAYYTAGGNSYKFSFSTGNFTETGTTVYLATDTQSFGSTAVDFYWSGSFTAACNIVIGAAGIYMTDGGSSEVHNFTGTISGEGGLTVTNVADSSTGGSVAQHYGFTGDLSGWNGDITITTSNAYDYLIFGGTINGANSNGTITGITATKAATNSNVSGTGAISVDYGVVEYVYTAGANGQTGETLTVTNSSIEAHQIIFTGGVNYDVSSNLIGWDNSSGTSSSDSTLEISTTGTVTVSGEVSGFDHIVVSENSGLTVSAGASVTLKENGDLTVNSGATLTLNTSIAATGATVEFASGASLVLTDAFLASTINTLDTYDAVTIIAASVINYNGSELSEDNIDEFASIVSTSDNYLLDNWSYSDGVLSASVTYLPEPSMFGLMFGLGAIGLVATRRRKRA